MIDTTKILDLEKLTRTPGYQANIPGARPPEWGTRPTGDYGWGGAGWTPAGDIPAEWAKFSTQPWSSELASAASWPQPTTAIDLERLSRTPGYTANIPGARPPEWGTRPDAGYSWGGTSWMPTTQIPQEWAKFSEQPWSSELGAAAFMQQPQQLPPPPGQMFDIEKLTRTPGYTTNIPGARPPEWETYPGEGYSWGGTRWMRTEEIPAEWAKFSTQPWSPEAVSMAAAQPWKQIEEAPPGGEEFPYPTQWGVASDVLTEMAQTGMPGMTEEYAQQAWLPYKRRGQEEAMQAREQAGLSGLRWSTPLAGRLEDIWGGASERFGSEMEQMRMQDIAGQRGARLGATGQLAGLGEQYARLPTDISQQMMGMGGMLQQMQQQEIAPLLQEFMRTQPEYSPLLQYMFGGATGLPTGPQMYGPSAGGNIMSWLPFLLGLL